MELVLNYNLNNWSMKKLKWTMLAVLTLAVLSISFVACSSSDDDDRGDGTGVVGVWEGKSGTNDTVVATFRSNGTGTMDWEIIDDETYYSTESFSYVKDSETSGIMTVKRADDDSSSRGSSGSSTYILTYSISGNTMTLTKSSGRILATLTRR